MTSWKVCEGGRHQQKMLYDHAIADQDSAIRHHVLVKASGRPTGSTCRNLSHYKHVENTLNPKRRRRCGRCGNLGHNGRACRQAAQAQAVPTAPPSLWQIEDIYHFDHVLDAVNAASNIELWCRCWHSLAIYMFLFLRCHHYINIFFKLHINVCLIGSLTTF